MSDLLGYQGKTVVMTGCATGMGAGLLAPAAITLKAIQGFSKLGRAFPDVRCHYHGGDHASQYRPPPGCDEVR